MVINQLLSDGLVHPSERIVLTSQVSAQLGQGVGHQLLHVNPLLLGDAGGQTEPVNVATNTDTGGVDGHAGLDVANHLLGVHVGGVLGVGGDPVILLDDGIEDLGEVLVGVPVSSVDTSVLVVELHSAGDGLGDGEAAGLGLDVLDFVPSLLGDVLGHQGVGGLDDGELSGHVCCGLAGWSEGLLDKYLLFKCQVFVWKNASDKTLKRLTYFFVNSICFDVVLL